MSYNRRFLSMTSMLSSNLNPLVPSQQLFSIKMDGDSHRHIAQLLSVPIFLVNR
jgi:hypothetical protein